MVMASLARSLKAWCALLVPVSPRWAHRHNQQRRRLPTMEFRTFQAAFIEIPSQILTSGRRVRWRVLAYNEWLSTFFRLAYSMSRTHTPGRDGTGPRLDALGELVTNVVWCGLDQVSDLVSGLGRGFHRGASSHPQGAAQLRSTVANLITA